MNCPKCGTPAEATEEFCGNCGQALKFASSHDPTVVAGQPPAWGPSYPAPPTPPFTRTETPFPPGSSYPVGGPYPSYPANPPYPAPAKSDNRTALWVGLGIGFIVLLLSGILIAVLIAPKPPVVLTTPMATQSTIPTAVPTVVTANTFASVRSSRIIYLKDDFSHPDTYKWFEGDTARGHYEYSQHKYVITPSGTNGAALIFLEEPLADYAVEVKAEVLPGKKAQPYLIVRESSDEKSFYLFSFNPENRTYSFYRITPQDPGGYTVLIDQRFSSNINGTGENQMAIAVKGNRIQLYINDALISTYQDSALTSGKALFGVTGFKGSTAFSNLVVYK